jgi:cysteine desulfurase
MMPYLTEQYGNAASGHLYGQTAKEAVELARSRVSKLIGADPEHVFFTNSASEANNVFCLGLEDCSTELFLTSSIEHSSIKEIAPHRYNATQMLSPNKNGVIEAEKVKVVLREISSFSAVSIMTANNEIGTINPIAEIGALCKKRRVKFHTDATQAMNYQNIDVKRDNIFAMTFSGHKIYGPKGVGVLYVRNPREVEKLTYGGGQNGFVSGTQNVASIVGMGKACELITQSDMEKENKRLSDLRDYMLDELKELKVSVNGSMEKRLPNNLNVNIPGVNGRDLMLALDDVMISTGSACNCDKPKPSYVLKALGLKNTTEAVRITLGRFNTKKDIEYATKKIIEVAKLLKR